MPNLYRDTAVAAAPTPPLAGDLRADVIVVGAGFTGLSAALHLAQSGTGVVVLEAEEPGWGASGRNGGQINPGLKHDPEIVERDFGMDLGRRMNALAGAAPGFVFDLIERHAIDCEARRNGTLRAAVRASGVAAISSTVEQLSRRGAPVELLEGAALERATGTNRYAAAMWDRRGGDLNPLSFARGLARAALRAGARVHGNTRVLRLTRSGGAGHAGLWQAVTASGTVTAERVIVATNGYTDDLWPGLRRSIVPLFGSIAASGRLPDAVAQAIMPSRAVLYESGAITVYYRVDGGQRLLIGGRGPQREVAHVSALTHLLDYARTLWPALQGMNWTHAWGGRLAMTRDHYPHVHEPAPGILVCLGYNGRGVALATTLGARLAQRLNTPSAEFDMPITSVKTIALHSFWPLGVHAAIARGRVADYFGM